MINLSISLSFKMPRNCIGYFVINGRDGFVGGVGGVKEDYRDGMLYTALINLIRPVDAQGFVTHGIKSNAQLKEWWEIMENTGENSEIENTGDNSEKEIDDDWKTHKSFWSLDKLRDKLQDRRKKKERMNAEEDFELDDTQTEAMVLIGEAGEIIEEDGDLFGEDGEDREEEDDNKCSTCGRMGMEHEERGRIGWLECESCGEWTVIKCLAIGKQKHVREELKKKKGVNYKCGKCQNVMIKMRTIVKEWEEMKETVKRIDGRTEIIAESVLSKSDDNEGTDMGRCVVKDNGGTDMGRCAGKENEKRKEKEKLREDQLKEERIRKELDKLREDHSNQERMRKELDKKEKLREEKLREEKLREEKKKREIREERERKIREERRMQEKRRREEEKLLLEKKEKRGGKKREGLGRQTGQIGIRTV